MSIQTKSKLVQAFLKDHQIFMRLLRRLADVLESRNVGAALKLSEELDSMAGPHVAFEETVLYPMLAETMNEKGFVSDLYGEHQAIVKALSDLTNVNEGEGMSEQTIKRCASAVRMGLDHAEHCGTLISSLSALDECDQREALDELEQLRESKIKWTSLMKES